MVCGGGRRRSGWVAAEKQRLLPQRLVLRGELLPLPADSGQLLGEGVQALPQLTDLVASSVSLRTDLENTEKLINTELFNKKTLSELSCGLIQVNKLQVLSWSEDLKLQHNWSKPPAFIAGCFKSGETFQKVDRNCFRETKSRNVVSYFGSPTMSDCPTLY